MEQFSASLELKTVNVPQRLISGYACIHSTPDRVHDIIDPVASAKAVARLGSPSDVGCFIGHRSDSLPVGIPQTIQATSEGLYTETYILRGQAGDNLLAVAKDLIDHGQSLGMSIGYRTKDSRMERVGTSTGTGTKSVRRLLDYDLKEVSYLASQAIAHPDALVSSVKSQRTTVCEGAQASGGAPRPRRSQVPSGTGSSRGMTTLSAEQEEKGGSEQMSSKTQPQPRAARRAAAEAELQACDAESRAAFAVAEAEALKRDVERRQREARGAELRAELDKVDAFLAEQRARADQEWSRDYDRRQQLMEQVRALAKEPLPQVRRSMDECRAELDELGAYVDRATMAEQEALRKEMDACESRRLWDSQYRQRFDRIHPRSGCDCAGHRAWRREEP
jgi:phage head maturation protease